MSWDSEFPSVTGRQRTCDIIHRPISCLLPNTNASNIETFDDTFNLFFDDEIMDMVAPNTSNKIRETLLRFRNNHPAFANSNKNAYVKEMPHAIRRDVNGLGLMVQLKKKIVPQHSFVVPERKPKIEKKFECTAKKEKMCNSPGKLQNKTRKR